MADADRANGPVEAGGADGSSIRKFLGGARQLAPSRKLPCLAALALAWKLADWGGRIGFAVDIAHYARDASTAVVAVVLLPQFGVALASVGFVLPELVGMLIALVEALESSARAPHSPSQTLWRSQ